MNDPFLVPCLVALRAEFNAVAPGRDKGADGWIGDPAHAARTSDHNPRPDGAVLALDIDSTGPWPGGRGWFDGAVRDLVERERLAWLSPTGICRVQYVIWDERIAHIDNDLVWVPYTGSSDPHTGHAHFSARHNRAGTTSTAPWGLEDDMTPDQLIAILNSEAGQAAIARAAGKGVHNQKVGASGLTIGQTIQTTSRTTAALAGAVAAIPEATVAELGDATRTVEEQAALLRAVLGDNAAAVGRLLAA
jgi:hypothetical protein